MEYQDDQFPVSLDTGVSDGGEPLTITGILQSAASQPVPQSSGLSMIMEPHEIDAIPGLPDYAYSSGRQPGGYSPAMDHVSLTPRNWNPSGVNLSAGAERQAGASDKLDLGARVADYVGTGADLWNGQNKLLGLHFGPEGAELLEKYSKPFKVLEPVGDGLGAAAEIAKGALPVATITGAGIKSASSWGGVEAGAAGLGLLGTAAFGAPGGVVGGVIGGIAGGLAPNFMYRHMSDQQVGEAAARFYGMGADVDPRTFMP